MPPPAIVATAGSASANSYLTLAEAETYITTLLNTSGWPSQADTKNAALIWATRVLDGVMCWKGIAASSTQALAWPRTGVIHQGYEVSSAIVPQSIKNATAELARQLIITDSTASDDITAQGITKLKAGPVELSFRTDFEQKRLPDAVLMLIPQSFICDNWVNATKPLVEEKGVYFDIVTEEDYED